MIGQPAARCDGTLQNSASDISPHHLNRPTKPRNSQIFLTSSPQNAAPTITNHQNSYYFVLPLHSLNAHHHCQKLISSSSFNNLAVSTIAPANYAAQIAQKIPHQVTSYKKQSKADRRAPPILLGSCAIYRIEKNCRYSKPKTMIYPPLEKHH